MQGVDGILDMEFAVPGGMGSCCHGNEFCVQGEWAESVREVQGVDVILDMEFVAPGGDGKLLSGS